LSQLLLPVLQTIAIRWFRVAEQTRLGRETLLNGVTTTACSSASGAPNIACAQQTWPSLWTSIQSSDVGPFIGKQLIQHLVTSIQWGICRTGGARVFINESMLQQTLDVGSQAILLEVAEFAERRLKDRPSHLNYADITSS